MNPELPKLRDKMESIESEIEKTRAIMDGLTKQLTWLAGQKSDCLKAIARLTVGGRGK